MRFIGKDLSRGCLCSVRSSRELNRDTGLYKVSWGQSFPGWRLPGWGLVAFQVLSLEQAQRLVGFWVWGLVGFWTQGLVGFGEFSNWKWAQTFYPTIRVFHLNCNGQCLHPFPWYLVIKFFIHLCTQFPHRLGSDGQIRGSPTGRRAHRGDGMSETDNITKVYCKMSNPLVTS